MRPSKRAPDELRNVTLERGVARYAEGSCLVTFGETRVLCAASLEEKGPPWLRGQRLEKLVQRLLAEYPAPIQGTVALWRSESHRLLAEAYPDAVGSLLPIVSEDFNQRARAITNQRLVAAGYRLGRLLDSSLGARVSRETQ